MPATATYSGPQQGNAISDYVSVLSSSSGIVKLTERIVGSIDSIANGDIPKMGDRTPAKIWQPHKPIAAGIVLNGYLGGLYPGDLPTYVPDGVITKDQLFSYFALMEPSAIKTAQERHEQFGDMLRALKHTPLDRATKDLFGPSVNAFEHGFYQWSKKQLH